MPPRLHRQPVVHISAAVRETPVTRISSARPRFLQNRPRRATNVDAKPQRRIVNSNGSAAMLEPPAQPGATVALGVKDLKLYMEAAEERGVRLALAEEMKNRFGVAIDAGLLESDWPSGMLAAAELAARQ